MSKTSPSDFAARVDGAALMKTARELARWEKLSGTPTERESFDYVKSVLDRMGWRTELISHDAYISLPGKARVEIGGKTFNCITHSHSLSAPNGLSAELVFLGNGKAEDFAAHDVAGKIVVIDGMSRPDHAAQARKAGAVGQIHVALGRKPHEMCISPVWGNPSTETLDKLANTVAVTLTAADGEAFRALHAQGHSKATIFAEVDTRWTKTPILVAELDAPNSASDAPFVLFSGHIDTWYYGVMDNGTANATMIEVARLAVERREEWKRGLRICFWSGHSQGRYSGSAWYADTKWHELDARCVAHVNVDSTGGRGASVLTNSGTNPELRTLATDVIKAEADQTHAGRRLGRQGDESFWGVGIPAMFGSLSHHAPDPTDKGHMHLGWWWHTDADTIDNIDEANLVRDTRVFAHLIWRMLTDGLLPLDYASHAADLLTELQSLSPTFDLSPAIAATQRLAKGLDRLNAKAAKASDKELATLNAALMKISRALVPMDSTKGDRFVHDPALPQPGWPVLQPVRALGKLEKGSDAWHFGAVSARQAANRMLHALNQANSILDEVA